MTPAQEETAAVVKALTPRMRPTLSAWPSGAALVFGRSRGVDLLLDIPQVSRRHGLLYVGPHFVTVTRYPDAGDVWVDRFDAPGPELVEKGGTVVIDRKSARIHLRLKPPPPAACTTAELLGEPVMELRIEDPLPRPPKSEDPREASTDIPQSPWRSDRDYVVLVALCERLLVPGASSQAVDLPSNPQIARRVAPVVGQVYSPDTVRNKLSTWRYLLGIPPVDGRRCQCSLAVAAVQTGVVTADDVGMLPSESEGAQATAHRW